MKRVQPRKRSKAVQPAAMPKPMSSAVAKRAVRIRKQGDGLLLSPVKPDWASFFALEVDVPDDFLADRHDLPPQSRDPL